eukprot:2200425-Rhodomonas_salina.1
MYSNTNTTPSRFTIHVASKLPAKYSRQEKGGPSNTVPVPWYQGYPVIIPRRTDWSSQIWVVVVKV